MVAVRTTLKLEAPVAMDGQRLVSPEYVDVLASMSVRMFQENQERTQRFESLLQTTLASRAGAVGDEERRREERKAAGLAVR
jgi:tRNA(Phe) wybutosine-synthesizing methylase Tyw3